MIQTDMSRVEQRAESEKPVGNLQDERFGSRQKENPWTIWPAHLHLQKHGLNLDCAELFSAKRHKVVAARLPLRTSGGVRELQSQPLDIFTSEVDTKC